MARVFKPSSGLEGVFDNYNLTSLLDAEGLTVEMTRRAFQVECIRLIMTRVKSGANIPDYLGSNMFVAQTICPSLL